MDKKIPSHQEIMEKMRGIPPAKVEPFLLLLGSFLAQFGELVKGEKPTKQELLDLIIPNIPPPIKGDSPTQEELSGLILSLVPSLKGDTPSREDLLNLIKPLIPKKGEDGKKPTEKELLALMKPLIPKDIEKKIEKLSNKVDKVLEGIEKAAEKKRKTVPGGKAGGMGDPQHETFNITTATTAITTAYPIAARGNAIMKCAYQGQILHKDTHFTVGNDYQTITFVAGVQAQFENGTVAEITYIR